MPIRPRFALRWDGDHSVPTDGDPSWATPSQTWLRQVHGADVVVVDEPGQHAGVRADAAVTTTPGASLVIRTADCVPVLLWDRDGRVAGAAHVGWRGLMAGVVEATVAAMVALGAERVRGEIHPHIRARCYEFGSDDLDAVADRYGESVRSTTAWSTPALDMTAAVHRAFEAIPEVGALVTLPGCTACEPDRFYSHRARGETGRHAAEVTLVAT